MLKKALKRLQMPSMKPSCPLIAIIGATGTGKSQLAVSLAERFDGEIINGDTLQIYRGLPIATNKISLAERKNIPHHLLDCLSLEDEPWTVRQFHERATRIVEDIQSRGKLPILVGGTQYYIQSLLLPNSILEGGELESLSSTEQASKWPILGASTAEMLNELRKIDPVIALRWHPRDRRKIRRSLEICLKTGRPASELYTEQSKTLEIISRSSSAGHQAKFLSQPLILWTHASTAQLSPRLDARVDAMVSGGLLDEVQAMHHCVQSRLAQGIAVDQSHGIWIAIGYKEFLPYIIESNPSEHSKAESIERTKIATRQYARRQIRWIRLKLLPAIKDVGLREKLFLLDASDLSQWSTKVETFAHDIAASFLVGSGLPSPQSLSDAAQDMLMDEEKRERVAQHCELCDKTLMSELEWKRHLKSKGHKAAIRPKANWSALYPKKDLGERGNAVV